MTESKDVNGKEYVDGMPSTDHELMTNVKAEKTESSIFTVPQDVGYSWWIVVG